MDYISLVSVFCCVWRVFHRCAFWRCSYAVQYICLPPSLSATCRFPEGQILCYLLSIREGVLPFCWNIVVATYFWCSSVHGFGCLLLCFYPTRLGLLFLFSCCIGSQQVIASDYQAELFLGIGEPFAYPFLTVSPFLMYFLLFGPFVQWIHLTVGTSGLMWYA